MAVDPTALSEAPATQESAPPEDAALSSEQPTAPDSVDAESLDDGADDGGEPTPEGDDESSSAEASGEQPTTDTQQPRLSRSEREFNNRLKALLADPDRAREVLGPIVEPLVSAERERLTAEREQAEVRRRNEEQTQQAQAARAERLREFLGTPPSQSHPGELAQLEQELGDLNVQIRRELTSPTMSVDLDNLVSEAEQRSARLTELRKNNTMASEIEALVFSRFGDHFKAAITFPEFGNDPEKQARYVNAQGGVWGALNVLADVFRADKDAALKAQAEKHEAEKKAIDADRTAWRIRAGGAEGSPASEGGARVPAGTLTLERYNRMSTEERSKLSAAERDAMVARHMRFGAAG